MVYMVIKVRFSISKYSLIGNRVSRSNGRLAKFMFSYISTLVFPEKDITFADVELHVVSSAAG